MTEAVWIIFAFGLGAGVKTLGLPPLIGYLAAGFAISASSQFIGLPAESTATLGAFGCVVVAVYRGFEVKN